jgi:hypothetical protein
MSPSLDARLLLAMVKEEWRLHRSLVGGLGSALFPCTIFMMTAFCAVITPYLSRNLPIATMLLMLHVASLIYGFFVGGLGAIGEHVMTRRLGQVNMLLQLPQTYPVSFRRVMAIFYIKDALFYLVYTYVPLVLGIGVGAGLVGVSLLGVLRLGSTMFLTFMLGMGLSFAVSAVSARSKRAGTASTLLLLASASLVYPLGILQPHQLLLPLSYWVDRSTNWLTASTIIAVALAAAGALLMKERYQVQQRRYSEALLGVEGRVGFLGGLKHLVAKELLELARSGAMAPAVGGYTLHLVAVYLISWLFENGFGVPLGFNVVFFSAFVGFMGVMTYSSLTGVEHNEYLNVMPVSVASLVRAKLAVYFLLTGGVTASYVVLIGFLKGEMYLVPQSLLVAGCTSIFVVAVTAYLTGLWTNTMFLGAKTILKFTAIVVPLLTVVEIGAMILPYMEGLATVMIAWASVMGLLVSALLFLRLNRKWGGASFSYVTAGA